MAINFGNSCLLRFYNPYTERECTIDDFCNLGLIEDVVPRVTSDEFLKAMKGFEGASLAASLSINDFMDALTEAWIVLGDDFELGDEEELEPIAPISFDELMSIGGDEQ